MTHYQKSLIESITDSYLTIGKPCSILEIEFSKLCPLPWACGLAGIATAIPMSPPNP